MPLGSSTAGTFRILSLDGGGIRGAFSAACLARLEAALDRPITDFFDLVTGTSTGGIIALGLGLGIPAKVIREMYEQNGPRIFERRAPKSLPLQAKACLWIAEKKRALPQDLDIDSFLQARYTDEQLRRVLTDIFTDKTLEEVKSTRLVIPAIDLIKGSTVTFKTPHQPNFVRDRHFKAVDVALATAAAPTYFPAAAFNNTLYCDGGLWANNPSVVGYAEAVKIHQILSAPEKPAFDQSDIRLLSIGTGIPRYFFKPAKEEDGVLQWGPQLFDVASGAQSQGAHFKAQYFVGNERYRRIDFEMTHSPWPLDAVDKIPELLHNGDEKAVEHFPELKTMFFETVKQPAQFF